MNGRKNRCHSKTVYSSYQGSRRSSEKRLQWRVVREESGKIIFDLQRMSCEKQRERSKPTEESLIVDCMTYKVIYKIIDRRG